MLLAHVISAIAQRFPDRPALVEPTGVTTYAELAQRSAALTAGLYRLGVQRGAVVMVCLGNRREHLETLLAVAHLGAAALPVDPQATPAEMSDLVNRFQPAALIAEEPPADWPAERPCVALTGPGVPYEQLVQTGGEWDGAPASDDPLFIMLSSGTTGKPKGAVVSHAAMAFRFLVQVVTFRFSAEDRYLNLMPLHTGGGRSFTLSHLYLGATVWLLPRFDARAADRLVREEGITATCVVPTMLHRIVAAGGGPWPTMRVLISSGAPLPAADREAVLRQLTPNLYDYYASVETGGVALLGPSEHGRKPGSVGRPIWGTEVQLAGAARVGDVGEVWYRSPGMISGYFGGEGREAFQDGWYRTGDLGRFDEEGFLFLVGRSKEMIITGGVNVFPAEVEAALRELPQIDDAAVVGVPDSEWGERVIAFVVLAPGGHLPPEELERTLRAQLAGPKRPKAVIALPTLPRNAGGKVDKAALRALLQREAATSGGG
jgi:acyl-CoA synthetase (AMP-forming)/AMP-acid ligase II